MNDQKYLELLAEKYPTQQAVCREIINLSAILSLPKETEHFMSILHGEYEGLCHILNNCSGVIREKVDFLFKETLFNFDCKEICTLIYYPVEKIELMRQSGNINKDWYRMRLKELIEIARLLSSKYTRSKVRKAMPKEYAYILDELIYVQKDEDDNQVVYHKTTGIAGYTLIFNSHGMRIKSHQPFQSVYAVLTENKDIESESEVVETAVKRIMVKDIDDGKRIKEDIKGLKMLLDYYRGNEEF
ncbi:fructose-bisphosphatase class III [uncultured Catenibacterium sp.]|uniref:fructose-bisphosphatase class III n=1 Tax=uncultured Catenibacterium sp. TaxID=286142 RepID=UPI0025D7DF3E|nr:fructose-bisphosphatase class III [uncultured Catenibacterium sp.]